MSILRKLAQARPKFSTTWAWRTVADPDQGYQGLSTGQISYETHSAVKWSNAVLCKRMRSATDKSKINSGCMQKHAREKKAALFLQ